MNKVSIAKYSELADRTPQHALVGEVDLVIVRFDDELSVFYGRCLHRGALMADGYVRGNNLMCGVHYWDYRLNSGTSEYANEETLPKFASWVEDDQILVDTDEITAWAFKNPQPFNRDEYLGQYADTSHGTEEEPTAGLIQQLAKDGLTKLGHHGQMDAMGFLEPNCQSGTTSNSLPPNSIALRYSTLTPLALKSSSVHVQENH